MRRAKFAAIAAAAVIAVLATAPAGRAEDPGDKPAPAGDAVKTEEPDTSTSVRQHAEAAGTAVKQGAQEAGAAVAKGAQDTGSFFARTGRTVRDGATSLYHKATGYFSGD